MQKSNRQRENSEKQFDNNLRQLKEVIIAEAVGCVCKNVAYGLTDTEAIK